MNIKKTVWVIAVISIASSRGLTYSQELNVSATCYSYNEPNNTTATGKRVSPNFIAVSRDVEKLFPMHTKIVLTCGVNKIYAIVEDRMGCDKKIKPCKPWYRRVDIFKTSKRACALWGVKENCKLEKTK